VTVAVNGTFGFMEEGEAIGGQRKQGRSFTLDEQLANLLADGPGISGDTIHISISLIVPATPNT
jgi:hypothetical protein